MATAFGQFSGERSSGAADHKLGAAAVLRLVNVEWVDGTNIGSPSGALAELRVLQ